MDLNTIFHNALENFYSQFHPNELAYLALTSKPEGHLRDAIAYYVHNQLQNNEAISTREWKRTNFAIIKDQTPLLICEFKCNYTFDCVDNNRVGVLYGEYVIKDLKKSTFYAEEDTKIYACLFLVHPKARVHAKYFGCVKYEYGINKALYKYSADEIYKMTVTNMNTYFSRWNLIPSFKVVQAGSAFDIDVEIVQLLIGPLNKHEVVNLSDNSKMS